MQKAIIPCISLYFIACTPAFSQPDSKDINSACRRSANEAVNKMNQQMTQDQVDSLRKKLFGSCQQSFQSVIDPEKSNQQQADVTENKPTDTNSQKKSEMDTFTRFWLESNDQDKDGIRRIKRIK